MAAEDGLVIGAVVAFSLLLVLSFFALPLPQVSAVTFGAVAGGVRAPGDCIETDRGMDPLQAGFTVAGGVVRGDYCVSEKVLRERYCTEGAEAGVIIACAGIAGGRRCSDGACVR